MPTLLQSFYQTNVVQFHGLWPALFDVLGRLKALVCQGERIHSIFPPENRTRGMAGAEGSIQVFLISHHPRILNFLAAETGIWFERGSGIGPTRAFPIQADPKSPISIDQLIERGWIDGGQG